jgi:hypothetical protein
MFREILVASANNLMLELPDELVGKQIEVLAFELTPSRATSKQIPPSPEEQALRMAAIAAIVKDHRVDLRNFTFDRDEANNYDE